MNLEQQHVVRSFTKDGRSRHVFVPRESAAGALRTSDGTRYQRDNESGVIRRAASKTRGKAARRAERRARQAARRRREATSDVLPPAASDVA